MSEVNKAALAGFRCAQEYVYSGRLMQLDSALKDFLISIYDLGKLSLPPNMLEENMAELVDESKNFILEAFVILTELDADIFIYREMIEDDGINNPFIEKYLGDD